MEGEHIDRGSDSSSVASHSVALLPSASGMLMPPTTTARIYLVRHGETQANREGIIQGQRDTLLNAKGVEQARMVGEALKGVKFDCAFSSDLSRAVSTAEVILEHHRGVELVKERELRERSMGDLEGKSAKGVSLKLVAGVESSAAFGRRATMWWKERILGNVVGTTSSCRKNVLVTTHGGFITMLVRDLMGSRSVVAGPGVVVCKCFNASVTVIDVQHNGKGVLVRYGDISHLDAEVLESSADQVRVDE